MRQLARSRVRVAATSLPAEFTLRGAIGSAAPADAERQQDQVPASPGRNTKDRDPRLGSVKASAHQVPYGLDRLHMPGVQPGAPAPGPGIADLDRSACQRSVGDGLPRDGAAAGV